MSYLQIIFSNDFTIIASLISLGFFGGFTHCMGMCGPFVMTQVSNRLEKVPLEKFSSLQKLQNLALLPYHLGRITTYSIIGVFCSFFTQNIEDLTHFEYISAAFLLVASIIFLGLFLEKNIFNICLSFLKIFFKNKLPFKSKTLENKGLKLNFLFRQVSKVILPSLLQNPKGLNGYFLGVILGFIPCGLLYGAFLLAGATTNPAFAGFGMCLFGLATFPALFLTASGGYIFLKILTKEFKIFSKAIILLNSITLFIMAVSLAS